MEDQKQHVIDSLKQGTNILVTVRNSPSIDQLSACIALTLMLNELGKHGTAVFSGKVPSVLEFLEPEKTIEKNTDSLQDFIISLDKAKADKLRYKVEDTVVKIFITPYRTSLSPSDLEFGQGDFNVDVVVALGVHHQDDLDEAITAHGRILHDATVISVNTEGGGDSELGSINWTDTSVSSLSELVASIASQLGKDEVMDNQVATALLTGIVAETERFGNAKTTPATMEAAAKLLAAGANQELVASKLSEPAQLTQALSEPQSSDEPQYIEPIEQTQSPAAPADAGTLEIEHLTGQLAEADSQEAGTDNHEGIPPLYHPGLENDHQADPDANKPNSDNTPAFLEPLTQAQESESAGRREAPPQASEDQATLDYLKDRKVNVDGHRARIEPLRSQDKAMEGEGSSADPAQLDNDKFALAPPSMGGTLTANMPSSKPAEAGSTDAIAPILSHDKPGVVPSKADEASDKQPSKAGAADNNGLISPLINPLLTATQPTPEAASNTVTAPSAPAPAGEGSQTLADLEKQLHSPHVAGAMDMPKPPAPIAAGPNVALPTPQSTSSPAGSAAPAPPVPPPLSPVNP